MRLVECIFLFSMVFWNVENFFDCVDQGSSASDKEFSARGTRHWNRARYDAKLSMVGKTFLWCEDLPSVIGLAEIENERVVKGIVYSDVLRKCGYRYVHYDSRDPRGIDVALLYREDEFERIASYPIHVDTLLTRDILYAMLQHRSTGEIWHVFVNHHPSKYGGGKSSQRRVVAMKALRRSVDSLLVSGAGNIVAMGDFNDVPSGEAFSQMEGALVNLGVALNEEAAAAQQVGSIRFRGYWQLIDNFLVSRDVAAYMRMDILKPPFLLERDNQYPGEKPRRTYIGPRYNGGVSDHLPIYLH